MVITSLAWNRIRGWGGLLRRKRGQGQESGFRVNPLTRGRFQAANGQPVRLRLSVVVGPDPANY